MCHISKPSRKLLDALDSVGCWNYFPSPHLQVMWLVMWLVSVSPGRSAYPEVVRVHSNYVYKMCSMHQYELVPLPPNFHLSSYYKPTNSKSKHPCYLLLCTVGASSTGYGPWCQQQQCLSSTLMAAAKTSFSCNQYAFCTLLSAMQLPSALHTSNAALCTYHSAMLLISAPHSLVMRLKD